MGLGLRALAWALVPIGCAAGRKQPSGAASSQRPVNAHLDGSPGRGGSAGPGEMLGTGGDPM